MSQKNDKKWNPTVKKWQKMIFSNHFFSVIQIYELWSVSLYITALKNISYYIDNKYINILSPK